jgi:thiamine biosynthesis lipoprotein
MGMPVRIRLYGPGEERARVVATAAFSRVAELDRMMSDYRPESELRRISGSWTVVSPDLFAVLERASEIAEATRGAFDPSVGPLVALWRESRAKRRLPEPSALAGGLATVGWKHVELDRSRRAVRLARPGMRLDLGGIAKGYILQEALRAMAGLGVTRALVEAGGDIVVGDAPQGRDGWRIEVDDGGAEAFVARAARLVNAALATSGPAIQFVEIAGVRYSHVIDPRTGRGLTNRVTARVIAADGATADALATALTVLDAGEAPGVLARFPGVLTDVVRR